MIVRRCPDALALALVETTIVLDLLPVHSFLWATKTNRLKTSLLGIVKEIAMAIVTVRYALCHTSDRFCCVPIEKGTGEFSL